jgi:hypothetical protein
MSEGQGRFFCDAPVCCAKAALKRPQSRRFANFGVGFQVRQQGCALASFAVILEHFKNVSHRH